MQKLKCFNQILKYILDMCVEFSAISFYTIEANVYLYLSN
jgi:hypothetical protein